MQEPIHSINMLFDQLGLDSADNSIDNFIEDHRPLAKETQLHEAAMWSTSQSKLLSQLKNEDADWAIIVDELDARLR